MPALQVFRERFPEAKLCMLCKASVRGIWEAWGKFDRILDLAPGLSGSLQATQALKKEGFTKAILFTRSLRSACIAFGAGIPERSGWPGNGRRLLLNRCVSRNSKDSTNIHQSYEYYSLLFSDNDEQDIILPAPHIELSSDTKRGESIAFLPGAARGPSKQWPAENYSALARALNEKNIPVQIFGTPAEQELAEKIARDAGPETISLAGKLSFAEWLENLANSRAVVCNDSGGMHVAAALGTPLVALFGITDPDKTGPLGKHSRVLQKSKVRSRKVPRDSQEARDALAAITSEEVLSQLDDLLGPL